MPSNAMREHRPRHFEHVKVAAGQYHSVTN